jgi:FMN phosphatase YigB (HAD superfamily)
MIVVGIILTSFIAFCMFRKVSRKRNDNPEKVIFIGNSYTNLIESLNNVIIVKPLFFCINDSQRDINKREQARNIVLQFFTFYFTNKPSFEK